MQNPESEQLNGESCAIEDITDKDRLLSPEIEFCEATPVIEQIFDKYGYGLKLGRTCPFFYLS